jgi:hypothetical protein
MKDQIWAIAVATVAVWTLSGHAKAACHPSDLAGSWDTYAIGRMPAPRDFRLVWQRCPVVFDEEGRFSRDVACRDDFGEEGILSSGEFLVTSKCRIQGDYNAELLVPSTCSVRATMSADKQIVSGVGKCDNEAFFLLNMVRR